MDNENYTYIAAEEMVGARTILDFVKLFPINYHFLNTIWIFRVPNERKDVIDYLLKNRTWFITSFIIDVD